MSNLDVGIAGVVLALVLIERGGDLGAKPRRGRGRSFERAGRDCGAEVEGQRRDDA